MRIQAGSEERAKAVSENMGIHYAADFVKFFLDGRYVSVKRLNRFENSYSQGGLNGLSPLLPGMTRLTSSSVHAGSTGSDIKLLLYSKCQKNDIEHQLVYSFWCCDCTDR